MGLNYIFTFLYFIYLSLVLTAGTYSAAMQPPQDGVQEGSKPIPTKATAPRPPRLAWPAESRPQNGTVGHSPTYPPPPRVAWRQLPQSSKPQSGAVGQGSTCSSSPHLAQTYSNSPPVSLPGTPLSPLRLERQLSPSTPPSSLLVRYRHMQVTPPATPAPLTRSIVHTPTPSGSLSRRTTFSALR